jgi:signal transduction histidine kinase
MSSPRVTTRRAGTATMSCVHPQLAQAVEAGRRLVGVPNWPLLSACLLALLALVEVRIRTGGPSASDGGWYDGTIVALMATIPVAARRTYLWAALAVTTVATVIVVGGGAPWTATGVAAQLWLLHLASVRYRRWVWVLVCLVLLTFALSTSDSDTVVVHDGVAPEVGGPDFARPPGELLLVLAVAVSLLGEARRLGGQAIAERDEARQAMEATLEARAVLEERARIARELHDVVAHHISMVAVQAESARLTTPGMPEEGRQRLQAIHTTAADALAEMRRLLGVLRAGGDGAADRAPQPGLGDLAGLLDAARAAGTPVRLVLDGHAEPLPPGVDLTAYRVVQEALTNVRVHAPGAAVDIELRYAPDALAVRVRDHGPGPAANGSAAGGGGHGLLGMRERVAMVGGTLRAGGAEGGGFVVEAVLPRPGRPA